MTSKRDLIALVFLTIAVTMMLVGCGPAAPTPEPVTAADMPVYPGASEIKAAQAAQTGTLFTPWKIKGEEVTDGPYKGYKVEKAEAVLRGMKFYSLQGSASDEIKTWYETQLSTNGWTAGEAISGKNYTGQTWKRGGQVFAVYYVNGKRFVNTLFLNK